MSELRPAENYSIQFLLGKEDYLQHLLYASSKTQSIVRKRKRYQLILPLIYIAISILCIVLKNTSLAVALVILAILWYLFFPKWERRQYSRQYSNYIDENMKGEIGRNISLEFREEDIFQKVGNQYYTIPYNKIKSWYENGKYLYLGLEDGYTIIIPKTENMDISEIETIVLSHKDSDFPQIKELNWEFR